MRIFFFKQKSAYEMRISDWSTDVYFSDLPTFPVRAELHGDVCSFKKPKMRFRPDFSVKTRNRQKAVTRFGPPHYDIGFAGNGLGAGSRTLDRRIIFPLQGGLAAIGEFRCDTRISLPAKPVRERAGKWRAWSARAAQDRKSVV